MLIVSVIIAFLPTLAMAQVPTPAPSSQDESSIMNIWNYQIERKVKTSVTYKIWDLAVWEEVGPNITSTTDRRYYVTPPVTFISGSAQCNYIPVMRAYSVVFDVQLWEHELPRAVTEKLKEMGLQIREDQVHPLPFYQARIVWNNLEQELQGLKLAAAWINNLQQQYTYSFHVAADNNETCQLLAETLRTSPHDVTDFLQLQFTVSAAKIDSRLLTVKSDHIMSSQLAASLKNLPGADGAFRYLSSDDYNRMLLQISNQVVATEITSGDYVDAGDQLSLKDTVATMLNAQTVDVADFDDRMWNSTFWDPLDERPDRVTKEMNKYFKLNQTDNRWYLTQNSASSSSASVNGIIKKILSFGVSSSHSSSSNLTTDQMQHLLEVYDTESEIDGDKFIPKKLDLKRLNMNDMSRGDLVTEQRVKVKQVDIGGVLQVAVGNNSLGSVIDENRYLRQQIDDMTSRENAMQQELSETQQRVQVLENGQATLKQSIQDVGSSFNSLETRLRSISANHPNAFCSAFTTPLSMGGVNWGALSDLSPHDVRCPDGTLLARWQFVWTDGNNSHAARYIAFTCCRVA
jgi:hypothetical protein